MRDRVSVEIDADCDTVFDLLHDYDRRLDWHTLLGEARLLDGAEAAGRGVRSRCVGTWRNAKQPLETEYVQFRRGKLAAVRLTNRPLLFSKFAASIRHDPLDEGRSRVTYIYSIETRPRWLRPLLERWIGRAMKKETQRRLNALRDYFRPPV